jgi:hypothetical protein
MPCLATTDWPIIADDVRHEAGDQARFRGASRIRVQDHPTDIDEI